MKISVAKSASDVERCFPVMVQLREKLSKAQFVEQLERQKKEGYMLAFAEDKDKVVAVAGFRLMEKFSVGKLLYVDDLITDGGNRSKGYGDKLFDWLVAYAKEQKCKAFELDSGVQRFDAHRFYLRKRMKIASHHFGMQLTE